MKTQRFKLSRLHSALAGAVALAGVGAIAQAAIAPANTSITNQATVTYEDTVGNPYTATSSVATVTVAQIYAATIAQDNLLGTSGPGQTVYTTHTITNNGNGTDIFHISVTQNAAGSTDNGDYGSIQAYLDGSATAGTGTVVTNNCSGINGQVDGGEVLLDTDTTAIANTITIPAGEQACIVVAAQVPVGALNGETYELTVTAQAEEGNAGVPQANSVGDLTDGDGAIGGGANGLDSLDDTNNDRLTVTADAALQITKSAVHVPATATTNGQINYTVQVTNTGAATANEVFITDGIPANTTLVPASVLFNGAPAASGSDFLQTTATNITEPNLDTLVTANTNPVDINGDGDATDTTEVDLSTDLDNDGSIDAVSKPGVFVYDHAIPANTTVTLEFSVTYSITGPAAFAGGDVINNYAHFASENDADGNSTDVGEVGSAGPAPVTVPTVHSVDINDTGDGAPGNNDGTDEDGTDEADDNDVQSVRSAPESGTVLFNNIVTNNGNAVDSLVISVLNDGGLAFSGAGGAYPAVMAGVTGSSTCDGTAAHQFPVGTVFAVTNAAGVPYPGGVVANVPAGNSVNIQVRATLPAGTSGAGEYCASARVASQTAPAVVDFKLERLAEITPPAVDLANSDNSTLSGDTEAFPSVGTIAATSPVLNQVGNPGDTVSFPLYIRNDGGVGESFQLSAGATWNGGAQGDGGFAAGVLGAMHAGWTVNFIDADPGNSIPDGTVISATDTVPAGGYTQVTAQVTIPATASATQANFISDIDGGGNDAIDDNADGDNDYPVIFQITGNSSGAKDVILDSVDVNETEAIVVAPDNTGQVEPGGTITYVHTLSNNGNTVEDVAISLADDRDDPLPAEPFDFNTSIVRIDTNCDGTYNQILSPAYTGSVCLVSDGAGPATGTVTAGVVDDLNPGEQVSLQVTVSAKTSAPPSVINTTTVTATWDVGVDNDTDTATDQTTVVTVQLRADKYVALDAACDGTPDTDFAANSISNAEPGQCVIWQVVVENQSSQPARDVVIQDAAPAFTTYQAGSLESCNADTGLTAGTMATRCTAVSGTACSLSDAQDADAACTTTHDAHNAAADVFFYVGHADGTFPAPNGATSGTEAGGSLLPGEFVTIRFRVRLDDT